MIFFFFFFFLVPFYYHARYRHWHRHISTNLSTILCIMWVGVSVQARNTKKSEHMQASAAMLASKCQRHCRIEFGFPTLGVLQPGLGSRTLICHCPVLVGYQCILTNSVGLLLLQQGRKSRLLQKTHAKSTNQFANKIWARVGWRRMLFFGK